MGMDRARDFGAAGAGVEAMEIGDGEIELGILGSGIQDRGIKVR